MNWMILPYQRYFDFSGRSRRKEYWMFVLFTFVVGAVTGGRAWVGVNDWSAFVQASSRTGNMLGELFSLLTLIPALAVMVRRLHDTNRSGWWFLILFLPLFGFMVFMFFMMRDGTPGPNRFGEDPKGRGLRGVFS